MITAAEGTLSISAVRRKTHFDLLQIGTDVECLSVCVCVPCACVFAPYLSVCATSVPSLTQSVCGSERASSFYTLAPIGEGLGEEKQTC